MKVRHLVATACVTLLMACLGLASTPEAGKAATQAVRPHEGDEPERVKFFIYVLDVDEISGQDQNFTASVHLTLRWEDPRLAHEGPASRKLPLEDVWDPQVILANRQARLREVRPKTVEVEPDGSVTYRQHYIGPLSQPLCLTDFPLDQQDFAIHFIAPGAAVDEIEFVPETPEEAASLTGGAIAETLSLPDWRVLEHRAEVRPLNIAGKDRVAGFAFEFVARRYLGYFLWQAILPLTLIVLMSWTPFWVDPAKAELQFGIASSAVLTLIAFRFALASMVPKLPYLTRLDYYTITATVLVFAAFLEVLVTSLLAHGDRLQRARRIDYACRVLFPMVAVAITVCVFLL